MRGPSTGAPLAAKHLLRRRCCALSLALLSLCSSGCAPSVPACYAQDIFFTAEADDETTAELALLDCVSGNLFVENTEVTELSLELLTDVGGALLISNNVALARVELPALVRVGGVLEVSLNPVLTELTLPALQAVGEDLVVVENPELEPEDVAATFSDVDVEGETIF